MPSRGTNCLKNCLFVMDFLLIPAKSFLTLSDNSLRSLELMFSASYLSNNLFASSAPNKSA